MSLSFEEIKERRMQGAKAFIRWIDERGWCIAEVDEDGEGRVGYWPVPLSMQEFYDEWAKDMLLIGDDETAR